MKTKITGFISYKKGGCGGSDFHFHEFDMSDYGYVMTMPYALEVDIPDEFDPVPAQIAALDAQEAEMRGKFAAAMIEIGRQRADLLAITNEVVA